MMGQNRLSPWTALVIGVFGVAGMGVASVSAIVLYAMVVIDSKAGDVLRLAQGTAENLPGLMEKLPAISEQLAGRRAPEYAGNVAIDVRFVPRERRGGLRPVMTITNTGSEVVSLLTVRVVALNEDKLPVREWTEVVATPIAIGDDWRGMLMPGKTRHVLLDSCTRIATDHLNRVSAATEVSEIRLWPPDRT